MRFFLSLFLIAFPLTSIAAGLPLASNAPSGSVACPSVPAGATEGYRALLSIGGYGFCTITKCEEGLDLYSNKCTPPPQISWFSQDQSTLEGDYYVTLRAKVPRPVLSDVSIAIDSSQSTAAPEDFSVAPQLSFLNGQTISEPYSVYLHRRAGYQGTREIKLKLQSSSDSRVATSSEAVLTITVNDSEQGSILPILTVSSSPSSVKEGESAVLILTTDQVLSQLFPTLVTLNTTDTDGNVAQTKITASFPARGKTVTIPVSTLIRQDTDQDRQVSYSISFKTLNFQALPSAVIQIRNSDTQGEISFNQAFTKEMTAQAQVSSLEASEVYLTSDPSCLSGGSWAQLASEIEVPLLNQDAVNTIYARFKNSLGGIGKCKSAQITQDSISPTLSIPTLSSDSSAGLETPVITVSSASDSGSGIKPGMEARVLDQSDAEVIPWTSFTSPQSISFLSPAGNGSYRVEVKVSDNAGNETIQTSLPFSVVSGPETPKAVLAQTQVNSLWETPALTITKVDGSSESGVVKHLGKVFEASTNEMVAEDIELSGTNTVQDLNLKPNTAYYVQVASEDGNGSRSEYSASTANFTTYDLCNVSSGVTKKEFYTKANRLAQEWIVPEGIHHICAKVFGGAGGSKQVQGGGAFTYGGYVRVILKVEPNDSYMIMVGDAGFPAFMDTLGHPTNATGSLGGFPGGGNGGNGILPYMGGGAGGGGYSSIYKGLNTEFTDMTKAIVVAAGGGGQGSSSGSNVNPAGVDPIMTLNPSGTNATTLGPGLAGSVGAPNGALTCMANLTYMTPTKGSGTQGGRGAFGNAPINTYIVSGGGGGGYFGGGGGGIVWYSPNAICNAYGPVYSFLPGGAGSNYADYSNPNVNVQDSGSTSLISQNPTWDIDLLEQSNLSHYYSQGKTTQSIRYTLYGTDTADGPWNAQGWVLLRY